MNEFFILKHEWGARSTFSKKSEVWFPILFFSVFIDLFRFEIKWNTCDKEQNCIKSNEPREEQIHGLLKSNGISNLLHQDSQCACNISQPD